VARGLRSPAVPLLATWRRKRRDTARVVLQAVVIAAAASNPCRSLPGCWVPRSRASETHRRPSRGQLPIDLRAPARAMARASPSRESRRHALQRGESVRCGSRRRGDQAAGRTGGDPHRRDGTPWELSRCAARPRLRSPDISVKPWRGSPRTEPKTGRNPINLPSPAKTMTRASPTREPNNAVRKQAGTPKTRRRDFKTHRRPSRNRKPIDPSSPARTLARESPSREPRNRPRLRDGSERSGSRRRWDRAAGRMGGDQHQRDGPPCFRLLGLALDSGRYNV